MEKDEINNLTKHNRFLRKLEAKRPGQYHTLDIYQSFDENMTFICNHCGYVTSAKPKNILNSKSCRGCITKAKQKDAMKPKAVFQKEVDAVWGKGLYRVDEDYRNNHTKIAVTHLECGHTWKVQPQHLLNRKGCPDCKGTSYNERIIFNLLKTNHIPFEYQKRLEINNELHIFDFYIPSYQLWIEYDGVQHTDKNNSWYREDGVRHDRIKDAYVAEINETMLRIPYTVISINDIISYINANTELNLIRDEKSSLLKGLTNRVNIVNYYKTHTGEETAQHFQIKRSTVVDAAKHLDFSKKAYNRKPVS